MGIRTLLKCKHEDGASGARLQKLQVPKLIAHNFMAAADSVV